jgi:hypothetical protein
MADLKRPMQTPAIDEEVLPLLLKLLQNICTHPNEPKYRKLRLANKKFLRLWQNQHIQQLLLAVGFEEHIDAGIVVLHNKGAPAGVDPIADDTPLDGGQLYMAGAAVEQVSVA